MSINEDGRRNLCHQGTMYSMNDKMEHVMPHVKVKSLPPLWRSGTRRFKCVAETWHWQGARLTLVAGQHAPLDQRYEQWWMTHNIFSEIWYILVVLQFLWLCTNSFTLVKHWCVRDVIRIALDNGVSLYWSSIGTLGIIMLKFELKCKYVSLANISCAINHHSCSGFDNLVTLFQLSRFTRNSV